jgi:hypothetical protein
MSRYQDGPARPSTESVAPTADAPSRGWSGLVIQLQETRVRETVLPRHSGVYQYIWHTVTGSVRRDMLHTMVQRHADAQAPHLWACLATDGMIRGRNLPPRAQAWRSMTSAPTSPFYAVHQGTWKAWSATLVAARDIGRVHTGIESPGAQFGCQVVLRKHQTSDLPLDRLLELGRDAVLAHLVDRLGAGETWAATVLADLGQDRRPS